MKVIVTGGKGQLGMCIKASLEINRKKYEKGRESKEPFDFKFVDEDDFDITESTQVDIFFEKNQCDLLINCAAYTNVDKAETERDLAGKVNSDALGFLAQNSKKYGFRILHISTDYVFSGKSEIPYKETDIPAPKTVYGVTKLKGEEILKKMTPNAIIIRTSWLYSPFGKNFFLTMRSKALEGENVQVVNDQFGIPTSGMDLADAILQISLGEKWIPGLFHFTNNGLTTWYDFAKSIYTLSYADPSLVNHISSSKYPSKTPRPAYSALDTSKIRDTYNLNIPDWQDSLQKIANYKNGI